MYGKGVRLGHERRQHRQALRHQACVLGKAHTD